MQVVKEQEAIERGEGPGPDTAATLIQSAWRMRQAQLELQRLRQQQERQAEAAVQQVFCLPSNNLHFMDVHHQGSRLATRPNFDETPILSFMVLNLTVPARLCKTQVCLWACQG